jgi:hypothetical protein
LLPLSFFSLSFFRFYIPHIHYFNMISEPLSCGLKIIFSFFFLFIVQFISYFFFLRKKKKLWSVSINAAALHQHTYAGITKPPHRHCSGAALCRHPSTGSDTVNLLAALATTASHSIPSLPTSVTHRNKQLQSRSLLPLDLNPRSAAHKRTVASLPIAVHLLNHRPSSPPSSPAFTLSS